MEQLSKIMKFDLV